MAILTLAEKASLIGPLDYKVLKTIYDLQSTHEYIPFSKINERIGLLERELNTVLLKLYNLRLLSKEKIRNEFAYRLTFSGLDVLAIKKLYTNNVLKSLGIIVGEGKESNVYFGYDFSDNTIIVKFHRIGKNSYKNIRKIRGIIEKEDWIRLTVENAEREYKALQCISQNYGNVPKPLGYAYNAIAMEFIEGTELYRSTIDDAEQVLNDILSTVRIAYKYCGLIHGDLSEYNVIVNKENKAYVIDWPQWQTNNDELLERDLVNIIYYFNKKYNVYKELEEVIKYIKG